MDFDNTAEETEIYNQLLERPGEVYIHPTGYAVYILVAEAEGLMKISSTANLKDMTELELNKFIVEVITNLMSEEE